MPITSGLASGLRSMVWNSAPDSPKAAPIRVPMTARGSLCSITMKLAPGIFSPPVRWRREDPEEVRDGDGVAAQEHAGGEERHDGKGQGGGPPVLR